MIRITTLFHTAALGLIMSALTAQAAPTPNIPISSLPFTISAPGTYVLTRNLTYPLISNGGLTDIPAITIPTNIPGRIAVDLKGFTLTTNGGAFMAIGIGTFAGTDISNKYPITIQNGTISNFQVGVYAITLIGSALGPALSYITLHNLNFITSPVFGASTAVSFNKVASSEISQCTFHGGPTGISDTETPGGNTFNNDTFTNVPTPISVSFSPSSTTPVVLDRCQFAPPPNP
jgi:hypothetical protein